MSNYKNGRLSKTAYQNMLSQKKSEKSCHKKKLGPPEDKCEDIICGGCKILLIPDPDKISKEEFNNYYSRLESMVGTHNCCYDCKFNSYCNKCVFTWNNYIQIFSDEYTGFKTCPNTFIKTLKNFDYGSGRYSTVKLEEKKALREYFDKELKSNNNLRGQFVDSAFILNIYKENEENKFYLKCFQYYKLAVKNIRKSIRKTDTKIIGLEPDQYKEFNIYRNIVSDEYYKILKKNHKNLFEETPSSPKIDFCEYYKTITKKHGDVFGENLKSESESESDIEDYLV